jgi:hypothetical protein
MTELTNDEKLAEMTRLTKVFQNALKAAEEFADLHGLSFDIYPAYGMGGTFYGRGPENMAKSLYGDRGDGYNEFGWSSSSTGC